MGDGHRRDLVAVALEHVTGRQLNQLELEAHSPRRPHGERDQLTQPGRAGIASGRFRARRSNVLSRPGRPSQWSA